MLSPLKMTGRFNTVGTDGKSYVVSEWSGSDDVGTLLSGPKFEWAVKKLTLASGESVDSLGNGKYEVEKTGLVLTRK